MKLFPIVVCLAVAAGEASVDMCNPQRIPTKLIARRTWPGQTATTAKPTAVKTTSSPSTTTPTTTTVATTTPLPILFNCTVSDPACGNMCGDVTSTTTGVVQSPNFPGDYGNEFYCKVGIIAPEGWMIQLKFTTFNLETGKAYVRVFSDVAEFLPWTTGNTIPAVFYKTTNRMYIGLKNFASDKPDSAIYNWQATFSVTSEGNSCFIPDPACRNMCTNVTSAGNGVIQSPNYPDDYGNSFKNCVVSIIVPAGKRIQLKFTTFNLETDKGFIDVLDTDKLYFSGASGSTIPAVVTTASNLVYLQFTAVGSTKPNTTIYNWQATYTAVTV